MEREILFRGKRVDNADYEDDRDLIYGREKIDSRLRQICGKYFQPWEVRYGEKTD